MMLGQVIILLGALTKQSAPANTPSLEGFIRAVVYINYILGVCGIGLAIQKFVLVRNALSNGDMEAGMQTFVDLHFKGGALFLGCSPSDTVKLKHHLGDLAAKELDSLWLATNALDKPEESKGSPARQSLSDIVNASLVCAASS